MSADPKEPLLAVPVINIASLMVPDPDPEALRVTLAEVRAACMDWGFFYFVGHGVDPAFLRKFKAVSKEFFGRDKEFKRSVSRSELNFRGYGEGEFTNLKLDWKETFDNTCDTPSTRQGCLEMDKGQNQWPEGMPEFKAVMNEFYEISMVICSRLTTALFATLGIPQDEAESYFTETAETSFARTAYYPKCPEADENFGVSPHTDAGFINIVYQEENVTSLQVWRDGKFYDVPPLPGTLVANIADMVQILSNDVYQSPIHQVLSSKAEARLSYIFAYYPSSGCKIEPLPTCVSEETPANYRGITFGEWRTRRFRGDYSEVGEEPRISAYRISDVPVNLAGFAQKLIK